MADVREAASAVVEDVCGALCPTVWRTDEGRQHHQKCVDLRAALDSQQPEAHEEKWLRKAAEAEDAHPSISVGGLAIEAGLLAPEDGGVPPCSCPPKGVSGDCAIHGPRYKAMRVLQRHIHFDEEAKQAWATVNKALFVEPVGRAVRQTLSPLEAQVREAIAILEGGSEYERLHVVPILENGLAAQQETERRLRSTEAAMDAYANALHALQKEIVERGDGDRYGIAVVRATAPEPMEEG